ncbi:MAG: potassium transporter TrkG [Pseudomonadota bacterium]
MGFASILRVLGFSLGYLALGMLIPFGFGLINGVAGAGSFLFASVVSLIAAGGLIFATGNQRPATDFRGGIMVVFLWWTVAPLFGMLPFILDGYAPLDGLFLAVSALTTTGAMLSRDTLIGAPLHHLWFALMQWFGGIVSISIAASIIVRPVFFGVETLKLPFARGERDSYLRSLRAAFYAFVGTYAFLTFLCFFLLTINGLEDFDAGILALSTLASGGLSGTLESLADYPLWTSEILFPFVLLSGTNFLLIAFAVRGQWKKVSDRETETLLAMIAGVGMLLWVLTGAGDLDRLLSQFFNAASLLTTNGIFLGESPPLAVAAVAALIGGAAVSTAGGLKVLRWLVIIRRGREEVRRLISPNIVQGNVPIAEEFGVWMHFLVFTLVLGGMMLILTVGGAPFDVAAAAAAGALSNTGPLLGLADDASGNYGGFAPAAQMSLMVVMILGRIEAVAALVLLNRAFWRT